MRRMLRLKVGEGGGKRWAVGGWMSLSSVYIRSLAGRKLMNRKWQKCSVPFGVLRKGWSKEGREGK